MSKLKKALAVLLAVSSIISTTACGEGSKGNMGESAADSDNGDGFSTSSSEAQTADQLMSNAYQAIEIGSSVPLSYVNKIEKIGNTGKLLIMGGTDDGSEMYVTDMEFENFEKIDFSLPKADNIQSYYSSAVSADGKIYALASITDYGDFKLPDYDDPDFDYDSFDWDAMEEAAERKYTLYILETDGTIVKENEIEMNSDDDEYHYVGEPVVIGDKVMLSVGTSMGQDYYIVDEDGNMGEKLDLGDDYFYCYSNDNEGNLVYLTNNASGTVIKKLNAADLKVSPDEVAVDSALGWSFRSICPGAGEYELYISADSALYGMKKDNTFEELINWLDSDLNGDYISAIFPTDNGEFIVYEQNWSNGSNAFYRLTKRDASELANTKIINMMVEYSDQQVMDSVNKFNKTSKDYRIKVEDYSKYYEWDENTQKNTNTPEKQLKKDISEGKSFDIICFNSNTPLVMNLANKGAVVDLYDYLGKDGTVAKDDIMPALLKAGEVGGKLASIAPSFYVSTLAIKKKYCDKENWTVDDLIETYNNAPDGMKLLKYSNSKLSVYNMFSYGGSTFIDYEKGTCSFDSPDFIKILEFCNRFDNEGEGDEIDWETATNEEMDKFYEEQEVALRSDKALVGEIYFQDMREYARAVTAEFGDEITLVGYPNKGARISTNTSFSIMSNSASKDECWKFIAQFFEDDFQNGDRNYSIPALKSAFQNKLDRAMNRPYYTDENGEKHEYDDNYYYGGESIQIPPMTKEQRDIVEKYILSAEPGGTYYDYEVYNIIDEEMSAFFAGEKSAQDTASIIQKRVSILVSEQS